MWQREFIITNTLDHKMIYSAAALLFSLTANSFDLAEILPACSSSPSISLGLVIVVLYTWPLHWRMERRMKMCRSRQPAGGKREKKNPYYSDFLVWVQDPSLSLPQKLYSLGAVIQLHPWPWSYCCRLNGSAFFFFSEITLNAPLSTSKGLQRLSRTKTPGTLSAYWADSYMDV